MSNSFLYPDWPAPENVKAVMTTRQGGLSLPPFGSLNLGAHVGDDPDLVEKNRQQLAEQLSLAKQPAWLSQVHGTTVANCQSAINGNEADAIVGSASTDVCAIMTADCLPALFCNKQGTVIAAAHAGWRGLAAGVLEETVHSMGCEAKDILVWMGAAIGPDAFEVGEEVREAFVSEHPEAAVCFTANARQKWFADIYALARIRLIHTGVAAEQIYGGGLCTYSQPTNYYSYRRESRTGRMASLIWLV